MGTPWSARTEVVWLFVFGLLVMTVGALLVFLTLAQDDGTGARAMFIFGCALAVVGQVVVTIGVIAVGVRLGIRD